MGFAFRHTPWSARQAAVAAALCTTLLALLLPRATAAQAGAPAAVHDTPAAYAWAMPVTAPVDSGVHQLRLPPAVYQHAQSAYLADLRVFDRNGRALPYALRRPEAATRTDVRELPVRIFPIHRPGHAADGEAVHDGRAGPASSSFDLELRRDRDGRLLSISARGNDVAPAAPPGRSGSQSGLQSGAQPGLQPLSALVLDLRVAAGATPPTVTALRFAPPAGQPAYAAQVWLDGSDDLRNWRPLGAAELQWLSSIDGATLACDELAFEATPLRYARITWRGGTPALFSAISALSVDAHTTQPPMDSVVLAPAAGRRPGDLVYNAGVALPAERAAMQFTTPNTVYAAMLGNYREPDATPQPEPRERRRMRDRIHDRLHGHRRAAPASHDAPPPDPFYPLASATFYDIAQDGRRRRSDGLALPTARFAQWVVRPYSRQAIPLAQAPRLRLSWTPATLLFLANGNGPYTLSFGRAGAGVMEHDIGHIAPGYTHEELRALPQAVAGAAHGTAAAAPRVESRAPAAADHAGNADRVDRAGGAGAGGGGYAGGGGAAGASGAAGAAGNTGNGGGAEDTGASATPVPGALLWGVLLAGVAALAVLTLRLLKNGT